MLPLHSARSKILRDTRSDRRARPASVARAGSIFKFVMRSAVYDNSEELMSRTSRYTMTCVRSSRGHVACSMIRARVDLLRPATVERIWFTVKRPQRTVSCKAVRKSADSLGAATVFCFFRGGMDGKVPDFDPDVMRVYSRIEPCDCNGK